MKAGISSYQEESLMDDVLKICSEGKKYLKSVQEEGSQFRVNANLVPHAVFHQLFENEQ